MMDSLVGIVANPASGNDIRRLVAYGSGVDNQRKVNIVRRALLGMVHMGIRQIAYMPDDYGIVPKALDGLYSEHRELMAGVSVDPLGMASTGYEEDSTRAAELLRALGAGCILTLGGDGTNRAVAKGCGAVPLVPVSTGTNNVFPMMIEGTVAGMAAGAFAGERLRRTAEMTGANKRIDISINGEERDIALIDAVVVEGAHIGSRALWDMRAIRQIAVTRCSAHSIGISAIPGQLGEIGPAEPMGRAVCLDPSLRTLCAPIAPGIIAPAGIAAYSRIAVGETLRVRETPCILALDGERSCNVRAGDSVGMTLTWNGPRTLDIPRVLRAAAEQKLPHCT